MSYAYTKAKPYSKKKIFSFRDLEVYQKTLDASVIVVKDIRPVLEELKYDFIENFSNCAMSLPLYIGEAHSLRFASLADGVNLLEKVMAGCNKMVIYLEQIQGIYGDRVNVDLVQDLVNRYVETRGKVFRLEKSWQKFDKEKVGDSKIPKFNIR